MEPATEPRTVVNIPRSRANLRRSATTKKYGEYPFCLDDIKFIFNAIHNLFSFLQVVGA